MKVKKIISIVLSTVVLSACTDILDVVQEGGTITEDQKEAVVEKNPQLLSADVNAMYSQMVLAFAGLGETENYHDDYGYPCVAMMMEMNGQDVTTISGGYNWFNDNCIFRDRDYSRARGKKLWNTIYKQINAANNVIKSTPEEPVDQMLKSYRGQVLALRAFNYWVLAQLFQFNYVGNEDKLCVPIVTDKITADESSNNPRASVKKVYDFILTDLEESIRLLDGVNRSSKGFVDQSVAYGFRARVYLTMQKWAEAASDAQNAISKSSATPMNIADLSKPSFNSVALKNVMWGCIIKEDNDCVLTGIINWPSMMCTFTGNGYVNVGPFKSVSKLLYDQIPATDVRKGWFLNENMSSPLVSGAEFDDWKSEYEGKDFWKPYVNVKFAAYQDKPLNQTNAQDWIMMRIEEMYYILFEAKAHSDFGTAKSELVSFVKQYRNDKFESKASDFVSLQNEIWLQRRIEFWGEGLSFFDIMRLNKPIVRKDNGVTSYPSAYSINVPAGNGILIWRVPQVEINANDGIGEDQNNPVVAPPTPI